MDNSIFLPLPPLTQKLLDENKGILENEKQQKKVFESILDFVNNPLMSDKYKYEFLSDIKLILDKTKKLMSANSIY